MKQIRLTVSIGFYRNTPFHYVNPKRQLNRERFSGSQHYLSVSDFLLFAKLDVLMRVGSRVTTCNDPDESIARAGGTQIYQGGHALLKVS